MTGPSPWFTAVATILGPDREPVGAGFLVAGRSVLTCAHVVNAALGAHDAEQAKPTEPVLVNFPLSGSDGALQATVVGWAPMGTGRATDIALLRLAADAPASPVCLLDAPEIWGHGFRAYGVPIGHAAGLWATGRILGPRGDGWIQLEDVKTPGAAIEGGFSGTAVYDEQLAAVVGMIVARDTDESRKIGFLLPAGLLGTGVPELAASIEAAREPPGVLSGVPSLPPHYLVRPHELRLVTDSLLADPAAARRQVVAIVGMGGSGKSVLAAAVSRDPTVRRAFPHGVVWIELGQAPSISERQAELAGAFGVADAAFTNAQQGKAALTRALAERRCLVVLDNVWDVAHLGAFDVLGDEGQMLITTRDAGLARAAGAKWHDLGVLNHDQAITLLADWAGQPGEGFAEQAAELAAELGGLPLALAMTGAMVAGRPDHWPGVLRRLRSADLEKIRQPFANYPYPTLLRALSVSVDALEPEQRDRYYELAVFQDRRPTPAAIARLWEVAGLDDLDTQDLLGVLVDRSLARWDTDGRLVLHDLQADYVRHHATAPDDLHSRLVNAYGRGIGRDWPSGPDDGYYFQNLVHHLRAAGLRDEARALLLDLRWLSAKLAATDMIALLADFELDDDPEAAVRTVRDVLRIAAHILAKDPTQLHAQLIGRLGEPVPGPVQPLIAAARDWRGTAWLCPAQASLAHPGGQLVRSLAGHTSFIPALACSNDGRRAVSGAADGTVRVWDLGSYTELHTLRGHQSGVWSVAITPDDRSAVSGSTDATVRVWDIVNGTERYVLRGHHGTVWSVDVIPGGKPRAASASADGTVRVWDLEAGTEQFILRGHEAAVHKVMASADGRMIASKSADGSMRIWDLSNGRQSLCLDSGERPVQSFAMALTSRHALFAGNNGNVYVWNLSDGSLAHVLHSPDTGYVWALAVTADGNHAISSSAIGSLTVWDLRSGAAVRVLRGHAGRVEQLAAAPDGRHILSGGDDAILRLWDIETGTTTAILRGHGGWIESAAVTPDGLRAISGSRDNMVRVWDLRPAPADRPAGGHAGWVTTISVTSAGTAVSASDDGTLRLWDTVTGAERAVLTGHTGPVTSLAVTKDASLVASGSQDGSVAIWRMSPARRERELACRAPVASVVLAAGERRLIAGTTQGTVHMWDLGAGAGHRVLPFGEPVEHLCGSPDGRLVAAGGALGTITIWDGETAEHLHDFRGAGGPILSLAFTPDGGHLVGGCLDGILTMWDVRSGRLVWESHAHESLLNAVQVLGDRLVSGGGDGAIVLWRSADGGRLATLMTGGDPVRTIAARPDGRLVVAGAGRSLIVLDIDTGTRVASFDGDSAITSACADGFLVCGEATGAVHVLRLLGS